MGITEAGYGIRTERSRLRGVTVRQEHARAGLYWPPTPQRHGREVYPVLGHGGGRREPGRLRALRWAGISTVFQVAMSAFNPVRRVGDQDVEAILLHEGVSRSEARGRMQKLFDHVGNAPRRAGDYPHEFSGGMR